MKLQHHIDAKICYGWLRPSEVAIRSGVLRCVVGDRLYDLQESYAKSPHAQFLNVRTDADVVSFVKAWGPLYLSGDQRRAGIAEYPLAHFYAERRWLGALHGLIRSVENEPEQQGSLREFIEAAEEHDRCSSLHDPTTEPFPLVQLRDAFRVSGSLLEWAAQLNRSEVESAIKYIVEAYSPTLAPFLGLRVVRAGRKMRLESGWNLNDLETALRWMVWYDVYSKDPLYQCQECRRFFKSESKHKRKFCDDPKCAKRATGREWRRKDLLRKREAKEANERKGRKHGTQKTR